jgi:hypothetical protein
MTTTGPLRRKVDREEVFIEYTKSICPVCKIVVDGQVNVRDGKVFLRKRCPRHGPFEALLSSDAQLCAGLRVVASEPHDDALTRMIDQIDATPPGVGAPEPTRPDAGP